MIAVIDYGLGNLKSIVSALNKNSIPSVITNDKAVIKDADGIILPGVGSFPDGMKNLKKFDLISFLNDIVTENSKPVLGICLGFQLMATYSEEHAYTDGLNWVNARVIKLSSINKISFRIPHVGWNECHQLKQNLLFNNIPNNELFYFTHSYQMLCKNKEDIIAISNHGVDFTAAINKKLLFGTQFHPEKSQYFGIQLIQNFNNIVKLKC